jgi:hypothetical protein
MIDFKPRLWGLLRGRYLVAVAESGAPSSSNVRVYNWDAHSTFGKAGEGDHVVKVVCVNEWGAALLFRDDGQVATLREGDLSLKIEGLVQNEQFSVAIALAETLNNSDALIADIHRRKGDALG